MYPVRLLAFTFASGGFVAVCAVVRAGLSEPLAVQGVLGANAFILGALLGLVIAAAYVVVIPLMNAAELGPPTAIAFFVGTLIAFIALGIWVAAKTATHGNAFLWQWGQ